MTITNQWTGVKQALPSPQLKLIVALKKGDWVLNRIEPAFRERLIAMFPQSNSNWPTTYLTALHYRQIPIGKIENKKKTLQIVDQRKAKGNGSFWNAAMGVFHQKVALGIPDNRWIKAIKKTLILIEEAAPATADSLRNHISYICPIETNDFRSASHPHFFGTLFLAKNKDPISLAVSMVHELAHQELFLINLIDRLITTENDYNLVHAPYQGKARPPIGRLHSAHALFRMIDLEKNFNHHQISHHKNLLRKTVESFEKQETTAFTRSLLDEVY